MKAKSIVDALIIPIIEINERADQENAMMSEWLNLNWQGAAMTVNSRSNDVAHAKSPLGQVMIVHARSESGYISGISGIAAIDPNLRGKRKVRIKAMPLSKEIPFSLMECALFIFSIRGIVISRLKGLVCNTSSFPCTVQDVFC